MDADAARQLAVRIAAAWNARDLDGFSAQLTDDVVWDDPAMQEPARGRSAVMRFARAVLRAFPDFRYAIREPMCASQDGTRCAVPWRITATHRAPLDPPGYGPTLRRAEYHDAIVMRVEFLDDLLNDATLPESQPHVFAVAPHEMQLIGAANAGS